MQEQHVYLTKHSDECIHPLKLSKDANGQDAAVRFDALSMYSRISLEFELCKYCTLFIEGGIYVDVQNDPFVALGDVLNWAAMNKGSKKEFNKNYAILADLWQEGMATSLLDGPDLDFLASGP